MVGCATDCLPEPRDGRREPEALLRPVIANGELVEPLPTVHQARDRRALALDQFPSAVLSLFTREDAWKVEYSDALLALAQRVREGQKEVLV